MRPGRGLLACYRERAPWRDAEMAARVPPSELQLRSGAGVGGLARASGNKNARRRVQAEHQPMEQPEGTYTWRWRAALSVGGGKAGSPIASDMTCRCPTTVQQQEESMVT